VKIIAPHFSNRRKQTRTKTDGSFKLDWLNQSSLTEFKGVKKQHSVLEALFPQGRAEILRLLFAPPQKEHYVRELMRMSGLTLGTVQDELRKLRALQLVTSRSNRYHRFYRANRDHALFRALAEIVETSEKTPRIERDLLQRKRRKTSPSRKARALPVDRPMQWHLFSKRQKT
jgi:DNA-binding MarR family transcriptional regulator